MTAIVPVETNAAAYRASTDAAELCKQIVLASSSNIQGKQYVSVEGWEAVARAHGCAAGATDVRRVDGGIAATGVVRDMFTGNIIATGEGFVGEDEPTWFGGVQRGKTLPKRADYAIRAMAQTRAISRACRSAFAHVIVMMNAGLSTTPAEEVPFGGFEDAPEPKIPGIHKIKERLRAMMTAGNDPSITLDQFKDLKRANKDDLKTIRDAEHSWWTGDGEDFEGYGPWIERRTAELAEVGLTTGKEPWPEIFQLLIASMKECTKLADVTAWCETNEALLNELDDTERREFEAIRDQFEAGLLEEARMRAG